MHYLPSTNYFTTFRYTSHNLCSGFSVLGFTFDVNVYGRLIRFRVRVGVEVLDALFTFHKLFYHFSLHFSQSMQWFFSARIDF